MILRKCPKCQFVLTGADIETDPFEARVMLKGGYQPIGYDCHQDILFVMATEAPHGGLLAPDGKPVAEMKIGRYVNVDRLPEELKDAVMKELRAKLKKPEEVDDRKNGADQPSPQDSPSVD
jgi:hypothetical protein